MKSFREAESIGDFAPFEENVSSSPLTTSDKLITVIRWIWNPKFTTLNATFLLTNAKEKAQSIFLHLWPAKTIILQLCRLTENWTEML